MGRKQHAYPPEYRAQMVELVRAGRTPEELSREFEPTAQSIRNRVNSISCQNQSFGVRFGRLNDRVCVKSRKTGRPTPICCGVVLVRPLHMDALRSFHTVWTVIGHNNTIVEYEQTFRFILILGFAVIVPIGAYHRIKSQATGEKLDRRQEGIFILVTLRPIALAGMVGLVAYMIDPALMAWSSVALPNWLRWAGVVPGIAGGLLLVVTFRTLGKNLTDTVVTRAAHTLVTRGPYRWVRHPFYLGIIYLSCQSWSRG